MNEKEMKEWIDNASYKELLFKWRFDPLGSPFFKGDVGMHYDEIMRKKKEEIGQDEHVRISKEIGW